MKTPSRDRVTLFLTDAELAELTGRKRASAQIRWLTDNGWRFAVTLGGRPRVARDEFDARMLTTPRARTLATDHPRLELVR